MKNKIIIALVAVVAWLGQSCETDPAFDFKDDGKIYFKYPKKINDLGIETDLLVDSIVHTVYGKDLPDGKDTLWIQLQIMGARKDFDRNYKVVVVADSSTGKEGVDFDKLADEYIFHRNVGVDSFPLVLNKQAFEKVFNRNVLLKLEPTEDLGIAYVEFSTLKVNFTGRQNLLQQIVCFGGMSFGSDVIHFSQCYHPHLFFGILQIRIMFQ